MLQLVAWETTTTLEHDMLNTNCTTPVATLIPPHLRHIPAERPEIVKIPNFTEEGEMNNNFIRYESNLKSDANFWGNNAENW